MAITILSSFGFPDRASFYSANMRQVAQLCAVATWIGGAQDMNRHALAMICTLLTAATHLEAMVRERLLTVATRALSDEVANQLFRAPQPVLRAEPARPENPVTVESRRAKANLLIQSAQELAADLQKSINSLFENKKDVVRLNRDTQLFREIIEIMGTLPAFGEKFFANEGVQPEIEQVHNLHVRLNSPELHENRLLKFCLYAGGPLAFIIGCLLGYRQAKNGRKQAIHKVDAP